MYLLLILPLYLSSNFQFTLNINILYKNHNILHSIAQYIHDHVDSEFLESFGTNDDFYITFYEEFHDMVLGKDTKSCIQIILNSIDTIKDSDLFGGKLGNISTFVNILLDKQNQREIVMKNADFDNRLFFFKTFEISNKYLKVISEILLENEDVLHHQHFQQFISEGSFNYYLYKTCLTIHNDNLFAYLEEFYRSIHENIDSIFFNNKRSNVLFIEYLLRDSDQLLEIGKKDQRVLFKKYMKPLSFGIINFYIPNSQLNFIATSLTKDEDFIQSDFYMNFNMKFNWFFYQSFKKTEEEESLELFIHNMEVLSPKHSPFFSGNVNNAEFFMSFLSRNRDVFDRIQTESTQFARKGIGEIQEIAIDCPHVLLRDVVEYIIRYTRLIYEDFWFKHFYLEQVIRKGFYFDFHNADTSSARSIIDDVIGIVVGSKDEDLKVIFQKYIPLQSKRESRIYTMTM